MARVIGNAARWRAAAIGAQVAIVGACVAAGWQLTHQAAPAAALQVTQGTVSPAAPVVMPSLLVRPATAAPATRPGVADLVARVNHDDTVMYRSQWATLQLVATATRDYLTGHVLPLLMAAARGGAR